MFYILLTTISCTNNKLTIDEKFDWNLDIKSLTDIFPTKDDISELERTGLIPFSSDKTINAFPHKGVVILYSKEAKIENITFKEMNQFELLKKFIDKESTNTPYKCTESGNRIVKYKFGTINTDKNTVDFKFRLDTANNSGHLTLYRPDSSKPLEEMKRLLNNPAVQCSLDY